MFVEGVLLCPARFDTVSNDLLTTDNPMCSISNKINRNTFPISSSTVDTSSSTANTVYCSGSSEQVAMFPIQVIDQTGHPRISFERQLTPTCMASSMLALPRLQHRRSRGNMEIRSVGETSSIQRACCKATTMVKAL